MEELSILRFSCDSEGVVEVEEYFKTNETESSTTGVFQRLIDDDGRVFNLTDKRVERKRRSCDKKRSVTKIASVMKEREI